MSEHRINSGTGLYLLKIGTDPDNLDTLVCLTKSGVNDTVDVSDTSSACGTNTAPGIPKTDISAEGYHLQDPATGTISGSNLRPLIRAQTTIYFEHGPLVPQQGDEIQTGSGFLSSLSSTYAFDTDATFSLAISPYGTVTTEIQGS